VDGVMGFLADAPMVPAVARCLERLWANRADLKRMGRAGAARIESSGQRIRSGYFQRRSRR
jgi:hypothetical protein